MALSIEELELQSTEYLPAREVLTAFGPHRKDPHIVDGPSDNTYLGGIANGINFQDIVSDNDVRDIQVGLVNVSVHHIQDGLDFATANADALRAADLS